jgi:hypothetical protein
MITVRNHAKERLEAGELALGVGLRQARTVDIARIMKTCSSTWNTTPLHWRRRFADHP